MSFLRRLGRTLLDLVTSKKAIAAVSTAVAGVVAPRLGASPEDVTRIVAAGIGYVIAQGIADHGKEAAKVKLHTDAELAESLRVVRESAIARAIDDASSR